MKGKLTNKDGKWFVQYNEPLSIYTKGYNPGDYVSKELPLHPDDVKQINADGQIFDNIEARIAAYPDVEFEIDDEIKDLGWHGSTIIRYAKITKTAGSFDKEGNAITRGYVEPTESWDDIMIKYYYKNSNSDIPIFTWLSENYNAPTKK